MDTIFRTSEISQILNFTFNPYRLQSKLKDKIKLKEIDNYFILSNLSFYFTYKTIKK